MKPGLDKIGSFLFFKFSVFTKAKIHVAEPEDKLLQRAVLIEIIMMKILQPKWKSALLYPFLPPVTRPGKAATKIGAFCENVCMTQFLQSTDYIYLCKRH